MRWIHTRAGRVDDEVPKVIVGISLDVTERRKAEEALKDVNHHKDEFLAMLAHELRNPLAPIRNAAQILRAHSTGQPELEWARTVIERQTRHLVRLVDDLLDVSRMVRGKIVLKKASVELAELVQHAVDTSQPLIRSRRHQLHVSIPSESLTIEGDLTRLAQAFANLLNNAAKYTDEGGQIWLDVWVEEREVVLRVRDTGPGISGKLLPHVFDLFTQDKRTLDRAQGGLGIGLTLVKLLVELHGGAVEARNADNGTGAEFIVRLPTNAEVPVVLPVDAARPAQAPNQSGEKQFNWEQKITMKWGLPDLGAVLAVLEGRTPQAKLFHKTEKSNSAFELAAQDGADRAPYFMHLSRQDAATKKVQKVSVPVSHAEAAVLETALKTAVARLLSW